MARGPSKSTAIIQRLLEERRQYEAWIVRLNSSADATPGNVRARVREDLQSVEADIQKLEELDALVRNRPAPRAAPAPPQHPPQPAPLPPPLSRLEPEPEPQKAAQVDELEFIKSVTEDDTGAAPSPRRASGAQFQPLIPSDPPRAAVPPSQRAANPVPAPIVPEPSAAPDDEEAARTLRCKACGTMNSPTEWYCGQCGAELAAV